MMKKHIVCFGDSNTHGYCADPNDCAAGVLQRFDEQERWPCLLQQLLGDAYLVLEEGLCGRTTAFHDPINEGLCGLDYITPCLKSHMPISLLIIMLGTNDTKERFSANTHTIALGMQRLVNKALHTECWESDKPNILIVCPPPIESDMEKSIVCDEMGRGCIAKSQSLAPAYEALAQRLNCHFLDAAGCAFNRLDYMHLTKSGHAQLAERLAARIPEMM